MVGLFLNFLYPTKCPACLGLLENDGLTIHDKCRHRFKTINEPRCFKCGRQVESAEIDICFECSRKDIYYDYGYPAFEYNETAKRAVLNMKQKGHKCNCEFFAKEMVNLLGEKLKAHRPQVLLPVPVHPSKRRERGFNQAEVIADILGEALDIPVDFKCLVKVVRTAQQKSLGDRERVKNSADAFKVNGKISYNRVCIVDDVFTTGSTINACATLLKKAGVSEVGFVTACAGRIY